jgi:MFS family permease
VGVVTFSHALNHVYAAVLPLTYPLAISAFHVSYTALGVMLAVVGVVGGLLQGAAFLYQRLAPRVVLAGQNLLLAATLALGGAAPSFPIFGAARLVGGVVGSPQHPVGNAVLTRSFPERRSTVLSWHTTGGNIGTLVVPLLAALAIVRLGWRPTLELFAIPIALGGLLVALRLRPAAESAPERTPRAARLGVRQAVLRRPALAVMVAGTIAAGGRGLGVINVYVPAYLRTGLHLPELMVGVLFTVVSAAAIAGPIAAGYLADRKGRRRMVLLSYVTGAAALVLFSLVGRSVPLLALTAALVGTFAYAESPLLQALFADAIQGAPQQAAFGAYFAVSYGAGSAWVAVLGALIDRAGFGPAFWVMAASFLAAAGVLLLAGGRPRQTA